MSKHRTKQPLKDRITLYSNLLHLASEADTNARYYGSGKIPADIYAKRKADLAANVLEMYNELISGKYDLRA